MWNQSASELFDRGGPVMWLLLGFSVTAVAVLLDRMIVFAASWEHFDRLLMRLKPMIESNDWRGAERACNPRGPVSKLTMVYAAYRDAPNDVRQDVLKREGSLLLGRLESRQRWLAVIGQLSPMAGLLGTVIGLVSAFHQIELSGGQVQAADLASGIWEALLTTVFGLMIAIPSMAAYHGFEARADKIARQMSAMVSYLDQWRSAGATAERAADADAESAERRDDSL